MLTTRVDEDRKQHIKDNGLESLRRLHGDQSWEDWMSVGAALEVITEEALAAVGATAWDKDNKQAVKEFNRRWEEYEASAGQNYEPLSKQERSSLREVRTNPAIIAYRLALDGPDRRRLNHPHSVIKRWKAQQAQQAQERAKAAPKPTPPRQEQAKPTPEAKGATASQELVEARKEIERLRNALAVAEERIVALAHESIGNRQFFQAAVKKRVDEIVAKPPKQPLDPASEAARQIKGLVTRNRNLHARVRLLNALLTEKGFDADENGDATFSVRSKISKAPHEQTTSPASRLAALQAWNGMGLNNPGRGPISSRGERSPATSKR